MTTAVPAPAPSGRSFPSLANGNFRLYLTGQSISQTGSWFQQTAEIWLILQLTGSGAAVGIASALRFGPLLLFGIPAGLLVDRYDRWRLLLFTQTAYTVTTGVMAVVAFTASPSLPILYTMILAQGIVGAVDNPLRRSFVRDLVTDEELPSAVSLNSTMHTIARSIGPAIAGVLIVAVGVPLCFALNSISYGAVLITMFLLDRSRFRPFHPIARAAGQLREGFRYAWANGRIRRTLIMVAVLGLSALNWNVILPLYASDTFGGDASLYGVMVGILGVGATVGGIFVARRTEISGRQFTESGLLMTGAFLLAAVAPALPVAFVALALMGAAATTFQIFAQTRLQLEADDQFSGRILAIYSVALVGTKPIGGLVVGVVMDLSGPRLALVACAVISAVLFGWFGFRRQGRIARAEQALAAGPAGDQK